MIDRHHRDDFHQGEAIRAWEEIVRQQYQETLRTSIAFLEGWATATNDPLVIANLQIVKGICLP